MRPLRLQLKSFTAFREEQEIDFSSLDVFAIAGPTGSGKSSLLDAVTYALFGLVDRVGRQVGQLVSQGQPRMAVTLEFEVGADRYRVTRTTPAHGASKVLLERRDGDGAWRSAGEGADRVRDVDAAVRRLIGLDYTAFTRSVLLPQGRFAEFLVGDPKERREILTELLGLSLFRRMAERAGALGREEAAASQAREEMVAREYADVTGEALRGVREAAAAARERERKVVAAERQVAAAADAWAATARELEELRRCAADLRAAASTAEAVAEGAGPLARTAAEGAAALDRHREAAAAAHDALRAAATERNEAERAWGSAPDVAAAAAQAGSLASLVAAAETAAERRAAAERAVPDALARVAEAETAVAAAEGARARTERDLEAAERELERARQADLVAAVSAGCGPGDPCPVCGRPLSEVPVPAAAADTLRAAEGAAARAGRAGRAAADEVAARAHALGRARLRHEQVVADLERIRGEAARAAGEAEALARRLEPLFDGALPSDPAGTLAGRLERLRALGAAEESAGAALREAERAQAEAERAADRVAAAALEQRGRLLALPLVELAARARNAGAQALDGPRGDELALEPAREGEAADVAEAAAAVARRLAAAAGEIERTVEERSAGEAGFLAEVRGALAGLAPAPDSLQRATAAAAEARRAAAVDADRAERSAEEVGRRLEARGRLEAEAAERGRRARLLRTLANELRADRIVAFLQAEALQVLAAAGSTRLSTLSDGRYRLVCERDEFVVVDTWNGDEHRSVKTLSGGETFLASLALALALSEQARSLSVTERARLDSLFLDEGFGSLDPESLRTVVEAIEQLGGDGRLVGVITHVRELAEQFPRIEVEKSPRGSRVRLQV